MAVPLKRPFQVLKRYTQKVYATPSRRKMDGKGDGEEITYPHICFTVDNFEDSFEDVIVRDGESVGIELTASAPRASINTVLFTACVPYETVRRVHDARASQTVRKKLSQASLFSLFSGKQSGPRVEYVRLLGGTAVNGHAELAVCKTTAGCDTPCSEPATDLLDLWADSEDEDFIGMSGQSPYNLKAANKNASLQGTNQVSVLGMKIKDFQTLCKALKKGGNRQNIIISEFLGRESAQHRGYEKGPPTSIERS